MVRDDRDGGRNDCSVLTAMLVAVLTKDRDRTYQCNEELSEHETGDGDENGRFGRIFTITLGDILWLFNHILRVAAVHGVVGGGVLLNFCHCELKSKKDGLGSAM